MPLDSRAGNPLYSQSWPSARVQDHCTMQAGRNNWDGARARRAVGLSQGEPRTWGCFVLVKT